MSTRPETLKECSAFLKTDTVQVKIDSILTITEDILAFCEAMGC
jgi:hypothetical protein